MRPSLKTNEIKRLIAEYAADNYEPLPVVIEGGGGVWLYDSDGQKYLDLFCSYAVTNFGYKHHPRLWKVFIDQAARLPVCSRELMNEQFALFCQYLANFCGLDKVLPAVDGAGAVERAIKIARKWGYTKRGATEGKAGIIACHGNFHGRTYGALSLSANNKYRENFGPFLSGIKHVPFGDIRAMEKAFDKNTVAVFLEPIQGESGVVIPPRSYLADVRSLCRYSKALMIVDEIQTGFGRTGYDLAFHREGISPDLVLCGKALGGGLVPISAVVGRADVMDVINLTDDGSTFGGYPLGCAVAVEVIKIMREEKISDNARKLGFYFIECLESISGPLVKEIRGRGLMIGIEMANETAAESAQNNLLSENIICGLSHNVLRINPPLIITRNEIDWALTKIEKVLKEAK